MCTVSFISYQDTIFITSNRDEHISRPGSFVPKVETINNCKVIFPKDPKAGGTWIAVNENGIGAVLLNGAFEKHVRKERYVMSRGLVLLDIVSSEQPTLLLETIDLRGIEPFTLILFDGSELIEFRWDEHLKHSKKMDVNQNHIWSSTTLYTKDAIAYRKSLFDQFISQNKVFTKENIIAFHSNNNNDYENGFVINRNDILKTFSITQLVFHHSTIELNHLDLMNREQQSLNFFAKNSSSITTGSN